MSFMENQVLGYKSPLFGRRTSQFHIVPFDYYDSGMFFSELSFEDKMIAYAVTGGIPQYLNALAEHDDIMAGISECFLKKSGMLYEELENLLKQELHEPHVYNTIFKDACCQYVLRRNKALSLPFMINNIGRWWGTNNKTRTQEEIDFIADCDENAIFGECKWLNAEIGLDVLDELKRKSMLFEKYVNKHYMLFSKKGFKKELINQYDVELIDLEELYRENISSR